MINDTTSTKESNAAKEKAGGGWMGRLLGFRESTGYAKPMIETPEPPPPRIKPEQPKWAKEWDDLADANPVGTKFDYLGVTMMVTRMRKSFLLPFSWGDYWSCPNVECEYTDNLGVIREKTFDSHRAVIFLPNAGSDAPGANEKP